jgi:hypothetical protein
VHSFAAELSAAIDATEVDARAAGPAARLIDIEPDLMRDADPIDG